MKKITKVGHRADRADGRAVGSAAGQGRRSSCSASPRIRWPSPAPESSDRIGHHEPAHRPVGLLLVDARRSRPRRRGRPGQAPGAGRASAAGAASPVRRPASSSRRPRRRSRPLVELSLTVPVVVDLQASYSEPSQQLSPVLERLAVEYGGRFLLGHRGRRRQPPAGAGLPGADRADRGRRGQGPAGPAVPGRAAPRSRCGPTSTSCSRWPRPTASPARCRSAAALRVTAATTGADRGVDGRVDGAVPRRPEPPLPPLHQEAYDAIERGDLDAAAAAYEKAIAQARRRTPRPRPGCPR